MNPRTIPVSNSFEEAWNKMYKEELEEHHHLSGAYIRSLVKQLTSPKTDDKMNLKDLHCPGGGGNSAEPQQPLKHKKQVRRRLHTSRPYQERLLNMAEARKEIVTALKCHRAAMKQQQQQKIQIYPSNFTANNSFTWSAPQIAPEKHNFALPSQPIGLNDTVYSSPSSSYSPTLSVVTEETPEDQNLHPVAADLTESSGGLHKAMGDEEMEEMRSIGEQHEMEWNDTMNLMTSAWWFRFFKEEEEECKYNPFEELIQRQFSTWFNPNELQQQQHQFCYCYQDCYSLLPW